MAIGERAAELAQERWAPREPATAAAMGREEAESAGPGDSLRNPAARRKATTGGRVASAPTQTLVASARVRPSLRA